MSRRELRWLFWSRVRISVPVEWHFRLADWVFLLLFSLNSRIRFLHFAYSNHLYRLEIYFFFFPRDSRIEFLRSSYTNHLHRLGMFFLFFSRFTNLTYTHKLRHTLRGGGSRRSVTLCDKGGGILNFVTSHFKNSIKAILQV